jgi:hypothetical protein
MIATAPFSMAKSTSRLVKVVTVTLGNRAMFGVSNSTRCSGLNSGFYSGLWATDTST